LSTTTTTTVPVLIVGGGPVGLAASLFLAEHGISSLLVERHRGTSIHPRAHGINFRTMELFRELGLEAQIRAAGSELVANSGMLIVETLAGTERARIAMAEPFSSSQSTRAISPTSGWMCAQDQLEPLLLAAARQHGSDVRFNTELVSFKQDLSGVTALVREQESGIQQLPIEIKSMLPWEAAVRVADSFQQERVFLAGDAAHQMPSGGLLIVAIFHKREASGLKNLRFAATKRCVAIRRSVSFKRKGRASSASKCLPRRGK
jgi:2-polyprenyl-6-methoxyphenol hydroxylase-like FAD-dependent oxidoreductase